MNKLNKTQKQAILFGIIIDPIIFTSISLVILLLNISMINVIDKKDALLHTFIGLCLSLIIKSIFNGYNQNWKKFPIYGLIRLTIAETVACLIHYALEQLTHLKNIPFLHIFVISAIALILQICARILFFIYYHKKTGKTKVYLSSPTMYDEEQKYIEEAFEKNWVAPLGFNCDGFESEMVDYLDEDMHAFATSSGTAALHLAMKLAGIKPGDPVLCSDLTFAATVNPVTYEGGKPVFIDSEYETWNMSPDALEEGFKKYPNAKVVVLVHLYGTPAKMDEILDICKKHNAVLIEDAAEALGATYKGQKCGTFGKYTVLSFNGNKIITTSGGGMFLSQEKQERDKALFIGTQARENTIWYEHNIIGNNYRMSNIVAGIGRGQLKHLDHHKNRKEEIYNIYKQEMKDLPISMNPYLDNSDPNYWLSCLLINKENMCKHYRDHTNYSYTHETGKTCPDELYDLLKNKNIETRPIWKPMHMQPVYEGCDFIKNPNVDNIVSEDIFDRGLCLPSDIKMDKETQISIINIIRNAFN